MSIFGKSLRSTTTLSNPAEWLVQALNGGSAFSGESVTVNKALGLAPFYRGVQILSGSVGMLPCKVYRDTADGRAEVSHSSRAWQLLHDVTNAQLGLAADEWWSIVQSHLDTWGNHFSWKDYGPDGRLRNLWPIAPNRVQVGVKDNTRYFTINDAYPGTAFTEREILHVRGLSLDGIVGYSPVQIHMQTLGSELARKKYQGKFWKNDATPGVVLIHPNKLQPDAIARIKALWKDSHQGGDRYREPAVLGEKIDIKNMSLPLDAAQFMEQAKYSATEQALILGIPPYMVGGDSGGTSLQYSTVEGQSVDFLKWSLNPRLVRLQNAVTHDPDIMPLSWFAEFVPDAILRTTTKERFEAYALADWLTLDEIREHENLSPLPDGQGQVLSTKASPTLNIHQPGDSPAPADPSAQAASSVVPFQRRLAR